MSLTQSKSKKAPVSARNLVISRFKKEVKQAHVGPTLNTRVRVKLSAPSIKTKNEEQFKETVPRKGAAAGSSSKTGATEVVKSIRRIVDAQTSNPEAKAVTVLDGESMIDTNVRFDDGADDSIVCRDFAESAFIDGIRMIKKIEPVLLQVPLQKADSKVSFTLSRVWIVLEIILTINSGRMAMRIITLFISDDKMSSEPLIIGRPVLAHFFR